MDGGSTRRRLLRRLALAGVAAAVNAPATGKAQNWPNKPIRIVVPAPPGGLTDALARTFGEGVSKALDQSVIIDNRAGAGGNIAAEIVAKAAADGHTFLHTFQATLVQNRALYAKLPFDPDRDFAFISCINSGPPLLAVPRSVSVTDLDSLKAYAKANKVNFGSWAPGSAAHIVCNKLNALWGTNMEIVHFRGEAPIWQDLAAGVLQVGIGSYQGALPHIQSGAIRPIAVHGPSRTPKLPDLRTMAEQGYDYPAFTLSGWLGLVGPANLPHDIVERMASLWIGAAATPEAKKLLDAFGLPEPPVGPVEFLRLYREEGPRWVNLVRETGVHVE